MEVARTDRNRKSLAGRNCGIRTDRNWKDRAEVEYRTRPTASLMPGFTLLAHGRSSLFASSRIGKGRVLGQS